MEFITIIGATIFVVIGTTFVAVATTIFYAFSLPVTYLRALTRLLAGAVPPRDRDDHAGSGDTDSPADIQSSADSPPMRRTARGTPTLRVHNLLAPLAPWESPPSEDDELGGQGGPERNASSRRTRPGDRRTGGRRLGIGEENLRYARMTAKAESEQVESLPWREHPRSPWDREAAWLGAHVDQEIAIPSYFFGPGADDIRFVVETYARHFRAKLERGRNNARRVHDYEMAIIGLVGWAGIWIGLVIGGSIGLILAAAIGIVNVLVSALLIVAASLLCQALRWTDILWRLLSGIVMSCPKACSLGFIPNPVYVCPRCAKHHKDIRPGRYGGTVRLCRCGARLRTSRLAGASWMVAECPHCDTRLPERFGTMPSIVIPFFGAQNVGKTQLMYTLVDALVELVTVSGGTITFDDDSRARLDRITEQIESEGRPSRTPLEVPAAYVGHIQLGMDKRLLYLFDAAGELYYRQDGLNYLNKGRCLVFVTDPLAADTIWSEFPAERQKELAGIRSAKAEGDLAYQQTREQMRRMGGKRKFARLAFVVSKKDLLPETGLTSRHGDQNERVRLMVQDPQGLDMGDLVRESVQSFAEVGFFQTAALRSEDGGADSSVISLALWLLKSEGIQFRGVAAHGA